MLLGLKRSSKVKRNSNMRSIIHSGCYIIMEVFPNYQRKDDNTDNINQLGAGTHRVSLAALRTSCNNLICASTIWYSWGNRGLEKPRTCGRMVPPASGKA